MKNKIMFLMALMLTTNPSYAAIEEYYEEKPIKIQKAGAFDSDKHTNIRLGENITFIIKVYQSEFFDHTTISANAKIDNATQQKVKAIYSISFHDKDTKLVGCHQGSWELDPNDDVNYGSGIIYADVDAIKSVTNYKLRIQVLELKKD